MNIILSPRALNPQEMTIFHLFVRGSYLEHMWVISSNLLVQRGSKSQPSCQLFIPQNNFQSAISSFKSQLLTDFLFFCMQSKKGCIPVADFVMD